MDVRWYTMLATLNGVMVLMNLILFVGETDKRLRSARLSSTLGWACALSANVTFCLR